MSDFVYHHLSLFSIAANTQTHLCHLSCFFFLVAHVYITALWHLARVVSMLEHFYGFALDCFINAYIVIYYLFDFTGITLVVEVERRESGPDPEEM